MRNLFISVLLLFSSWLLAVDMPVTYQQVLALEVSRQPLIKSYGADPLQFIEHWPAAESTKHLSIVFIHGGCWLSAYDIKHSRAFTHALAEQGYPVYSLEYRRTGDEGGGWPGTFEDIKQALDVIAAESSNDSNQLVLMGHSAGGHLALLAASEFKQNVKLVGVIGLAAIVDLQTYSKGENSCQKATVSFMGGKAESIPQTYLDANPAQQTTHKNTLLLHGKADAIVPLAQSKAIEAKVISMDGAGHFDLIHPQTKAFKQLLAALEQLQP